MDTLINSLLEYIDKGNTSEKLVSLLQIGDYLEYAHPESADFCFVVQTLINLFSREKEPEVSKRLFRNIVLAFMQNEDLSHLDFSQMTNAMEQEDPQFICKALYILSMTYSQEHVPFVSRFLNHTNEKVRAEAELSLTYLP